MPKLCPTDSNLYPICRSAISSARRTQPVDCQGDGDAARDHRTAGGLGSARVAASVPCRHTACTGFRLRYNGAWLHDPAFGPLRPTASSAERHDGHVQLMLEGGKASLLTKHRRLSFRQYACGILERKGPNRQRDRPEAPQVRLSSPPPRRGCPQTLMALMKLDFTASAWRSSSRARRQA